MFGLGGLRPLGYLLCAGFKKIVHFQLIYQGPWLALAIREGISCSER